MANMRGNWQNLKATTRSAFALRELLAVLSTILFLGFLAAPAMSRMKERGEAALCLSNQKQLIIAWQMYAEENSGKFVQNYHGGNNVTFANDPRNAPWAVGWMDWTASSDNTNILYLRNLRYARLVPYLSQAENAHKCPSDIYLSATQRERGWKQRVRSYSMNLTIGQGNAETGPFDPMYKHCTSFGDLAYPSPAETTVFLDEHPDSINDPGFFPPRPNSYIDGPSNLHKGAGTIAFADAHAETHPWKGRLRYQGYRGSVLAPSDSDPDISWLIHHSQRREP